jgi:cyclin A
MRKLELEYRPKSTYMKKQMDITNSMRSILVDWLVEVAEEYRLNIETLYLAVNYTDRFLSQMSVLRSKLQLVGTSSMYIASKYEEITPPDVSEFVYITDDTYTKKQVLRMEHLLLKTLEFRLGQPTINWFLTTFLRCIKLNTTFGQASNFDLFQRIEYLARYLAELTLLDCDTFLVYVPSQIAASAIYLSMHTFDKTWTKQLADLVGYKNDLSELKSCITDMFNWYHQASSLAQQAIQDKYKQARYEHVSLIDPPKLLPACFYTNVIQTAV